MKTTFLRGRLERIACNHFIGCGRLLRQIQDKLRNSIICGLSTKEDMSGYAIAECLQDMVDNPYHSVSLLDSIKESRSKTEATGSGPPLIAATRVVVNQKRRRNP